MKASRILLVLFTKEVSFDTMLIDPRISQLLDEYKDVFSIELPKGLPPIRGVEHQIDFVPGPSLPNKPTYKTNPIKAKEIQGR